MEIQGRSDDGRGRSQLPRIVSFPSNEVLSTVDLRKVFVSSFRRRRVAALEGLTMSIGSGEVFGLLGPNGAGKSTTIKLLMGLIRPTSGTLTLLGRPPGDVEAKRELGYLAESPSFYPYLTAREFLDYCCGLLGMSPPRRREAVRRLLEELDLRKARDLRIKKLSKGMIQKLGFAQAIAGEPKLLILDEPMSGLDPLGRRLVREKILEVKARGGSVLFSSHILPDVETICDRVGILVAGRLQRIVEVDQSSMDEDPPVELIMDRVDPRIAEEIRRRGVPVRLRGETYILQFESAVSAHEVLSGAVARGARILSYNRLRESLENALLREIEPALDRRREKAG